MKKESVKSYNLRLGGGQAWKSVIQTILRYDIVKAHGGELTVESSRADITSKAGEERKGTKFILQLPL